MRRWGMAIKCAYVDVPGGQVHCRMAGDRGPSLVCFHQTPISSRMYERALPLLGDRMRAVAFDTPGYGGSTPLAETATIPGYATQLVAAMTGLGIKDTVICGFATGSAVAVEIARQLGDKATHLILSGTPFLSEERFDDFGLRLGEPDAEPDGSHLMQVWESRIENYGPDNDLAQVAMAVSETLRVYERMHWGLQAVRGYDLAGVLAQLRVPALFLSAEHDKLTPENHKAATLVPGAREIVLDNVQPQVCWTKPERFCNEVFRFVGLT